MNITRAISSWVKMKITQNLLFILCKIFTAALSCVTDAAEVIYFSGYEGSAVRVSCYYDQGYESYEKYLCRNDCGDSDVLITTSERKKNKYFIFDYKTVRKFTVTISDLQHKDAGKYWCGVTRAGQDIYTEVRVDILKDSCCHSVTKVQSYDGRSVSISCPYESVYQNNLKYICRGNQPSTCLQQAVVTSDSKQTTQLTLTDDRKSQFTVTIANLTQKDSGSYLCGVHRNTGLDVFSAVELEVKVWCCVKSSTEKPVTHTQSTINTTNKHINGVCGGERRTFNHIYENGDIVMSKQKE
ncbi:polymeric immunoglobulin receptor-like isoform X2 [Parambassis ranga]|uniref:polymeric immunoglobulin receptor-like isoform X2 n=1 Tax=Parambassis ranga TaxID=210632 RepID=UPI0010421412|nr:polymeric immunoglobulin receptor-like isoform X2 [Parambassis ranga]